MRAPSEGREGRHTCALERLQLYAHLYILYSWPDIDIDIDIDIDNDTEGEISMERSLFPAECWECVSPGGPDREGFRSLELDSRRSTVLFTR